jgi:hypothetical protein
VNTGVAWDQDAGYLTDIRSVAVGTEHAVMIRNDGYVLTSGRNDNGQLGGGQDALSSVTTPMIVHKAGGIGVVSGLTMTKTIIDPLDSNYSQTAVQEADGSYTMLNTQQMTLTDLALTMDDGSFLNVFGKGGLSKDNLNLKVSVSYPIVDVLEENGADGKRTFRLRPVVSARKTDDGREVLDAAVGTTVVTVTEVNTGVAVSFTLVLKETGQINAPGKDYNFTAPMLVTGANFALALRGDGTVWAWGNNEFGQLGIDSNDKYVSVPTQVVRDDSYRSANGLYGIVYIAAGDHHALAVDDKGQVWTWGDNSRNQLNRTASNKATTNILGSIYEDEMGNTNASVAATTSGARP